MPFAITPLFQAGIAVAVLAGVFFLIDAIGDQREAKVHKAYARAADMTNDDIKAFTSDDEKVAAVKEALRQQALDKAKAVPRKLIVNKEQANALTEIRWP